MPLVEQAVQLLFSGVEQKTKDKVIRIPGKLIEATDVVQRKTGTYSKRYGVSQYNRTASSGSITAGQGLVSAGNLVLHANDTLWDRDASSSSWKNRGTQVRAFADDMVAITRHASRPQVVIAGGLKYFFTASIAPNATDRGYYMRIVDATTGVEVLATTFVTTVASTTNTATFRAIAAGGLVWVFYAPLSANGILLHKYDPASPSTAAVATTYASASATIAWDVVSTVNGVAVATMGVAGANITISGVTNNQILSLLDTTTGLPKVSPGWVGFTGVLVTNPNIAWVSYDGTAGNIFLTVNSGATFGLKLMRFTASTLAGGVARTLGTPSAFYNTNDRQLNGYSTDGDVVQVLLSDASDGTTGSAAADKENAKIHKHQHVWSTNTTTITLNWIRQAYVAAEPFAISGTWYLVTGYDDQGGTTGNVLRGYHLRLASSGAIISRALFGRGGNLFNKGDGAVNPLASTSQQGYATVAVVGNNAHVALIGNDGVDGEWHTRSVVWNVADTYGPLRAVSGDQVALMPGGWPVRLGDQDSTLTEIVPMMWPRAITGAAVAGATSLNGTYGAQVLYLMRDGRGNIYRSTPCPMVSTALVNNTLRLTVPNLRTGLGASAVSIEVYLTAAGGTSAFLNKTVLNDPTTDTQTIDITAVSATGAETIYTANSVVPNYPVPQFRVSCEWRNRVFLTDTDVYGEVWPSKETTVGFGVAFSASTTFTLSGGTGRVRAAGPLDYNYCAFFKSNAIHVISGDGPNDQAQGQYAPRQVQGEIGCSNPSSVVGNTPLGCFFQGTDGGMWLLTRTLDVVYIGRGVDNYKSATITGAAHFPKEQLVRFWTDGGKILVFDYGNPTDQDQQGQWYVHTCTAAVAATNHGDVHHAVDASGIVRQEVASQWFDDTNTPILPALECAPISFSNFLGYQQCMRGQLLATYLGAHTLQMTLKGDFSAATDTKSVAMAAGPEDIEFRPVNTRKCTALGVRVEQIGTELTEGFAVQGVAFELLIEPRLRRLNTTARI